MCPIPGKCARNMGALQQLPEPYLTRQLSRGFPPASTLLPPAARLQMPTWTRASLKWQGSMNWKEPGSFKRHIWSFKSRGIYFSSGLPISALCCKEGNGTPLQYSCLETPMDGGAWLTAVHGVMKSRTWLSDFTFTFLFPALEKEMATHSSVFAWRIPGTGGAWWAAVYGVAESDTTEAT